MGVLDNDSQLVEDQTRLEFKGRGQRLRDLQQYRLLASVGFRPMVEKLFCMNPLADITDDTQQAWPIPISERCPSHLDVERRAVLAHVDRQRFQHIARLI